MTDAPQHPRPADPLVPTDPASAAAAAPWLDGHVDELVAALGRLRPSAAVLHRWGAELAGVLAGGGRLLAAGNGGSAAEAQHLTAELVGRFVDERRPLSAIALHADTSSVTAIGNDYGEREVFARQVQAHGRPGDVVVLLSTSGRSPNVLEAAARARAGGMRVWALTGPLPNPLAELADEVVGVDAPSTSGVQEGHLVLVHALCAGVDTALAAADAGGPVPADAPDAPDAPDAAATGTTPDGPVVVEPSDDAPSVRRGGRRRRVVVVGDVVLDRDLEGVVERVAPDAPVPVVDLRRTTESPGGAGLTALLVASGRAGGASPTADDVEVVLVAPVGDDEDGGRLRAALVEGTGDGEGLRLVALPHTGLTRTKTRVRAAGQSLVRVDSGGPGTPSAPDLDELRAVLASADVVLVSDYGAGTTHDPGVRALLGAAAASVPVVWDPHPRGGEPVHGCALVTPNLSEAARVLGGAPRPDDGAGALARRWAARGVVVTVGERGAFLGLPGTEPLYVPAPVVAGGDPCGAGDRFAATAALALARGAVLPEAVVEAVEDASAWVAGGGAAGWRSRRAAGARPAPSAPVTAPTATGGGDPAEPARAADVAGLLARVRAAGGTVVATGGCFDVLHAGHVACLQAARRLGDALVVLVNSDASVRRLKGEGRPVQAQADRVRVLQALEAVDAVAVFDEDDPREALRVLQPDVWAKGGDYGAAGAVMPEAPLVQGWGGRVVLLPYLDGRSTTEILRRGAPATVPAEQENP
ncbi:PfkB family carbohydrate kinase [Pseudokineococcus lusitanus]|uniref:RfaE bifunctional protein kinase chain/domain/rfaE bifunctional protein nucleotidyltransferase chain/domain n=1 Tax=Pseudokineococcus lusitanus TaxID=763993 RepID=A0A3N1G9H6_9ACTN|nr:PfkB family carbohydrate kinase [Pseudokineococcus lusitanus]ROP26886.1 rfaE bifunctional protein kinase chain/domain/rfaE bifunctional protein nucleotidyltransferase chain/domain [Pseudokineococcus lusitanus]